MPERFLFVAHEFTEGGAAFLAVRHLRRIAAGRRIDFLVTGPVSSAMAAALPAGVALHRIALDPKVVGRGLLATREALASAGHPCLDDDYDAVFATSVFPSLAACAAFSMSRARRKVLALVDECLLQRPVPRDTPAAMRGALLSADHLVPVSQALLDTLGRHEPILRGIPATVLRPPIDDPHPGEVPSPFASHPAGDLPRVVTVARLSPEKQLRRCLRVHRTLRDRGLDFYWHVIGEGVERPALQRHIRRLGMGDRFFLEGFQRDPRSWMRHADLLVLASRSEGCPTVIREALAEGTPVVATDVNGVRELIDPGSTGVVVADAKDEMAAALGRLLADAEARQGLRRNLARRAVAHFADRESERLLDLLRAAPRSRPAPAATILIPDIGSGRSCGRTVQSALMQDFADFEVIVREDACVEGTDTAVQSARHDPRLRVHRCDGALGTDSDCRRVLVEQARGGWIAVLAGDDHFTDPSFLSKAMQAAADHADSRPLFVQAGHRIVWQAADALREGAVAGPHVDIVPRIAGASRAMTGADYSSFVYETGFFTHMAALDCREAVLRQGFGRWGDAASDLLSRLQLVRSGNVVVLNAIAGCRVQRGESTPGTLPIAAIRDSVEVYRRLAAGIGAEGTVGVERLDRYLSRYEARALAQLFGSAVGRSVRGTRATLRLLRSIVRANPRVCLEPALARVWWAWLTRPIWMARARLQGPADSVILFLRSLRMDS